MPAPESSEEFADEDQHDEPFPRYLGPLAAVDGMVEVEVACPISDDEPEFCDGWSETIELDEPAKHDADENTIELPGFEWECPECGNPHEFVVEGTRVSNLV